MPVIHYEGANLTKAQKQELVKSLTKVAVEATGIPEQAFYVFLHEYEPDNIGVEGKLMSKPK